MAFTYVQRRLTQTLRSPKWVKRTLTQYGTDAWNLHLAQQCGDDDMVWGPDPFLTPLGEQQAAAVHDAFADELQRADAPPLPNVFCSSPLSRSLDTLHGTWRGIVPRNTPVHVYEGLREVLGKHTCDRRASRHTIERRFSRHGIFPLHFSMPFEEEDMLWSPIRETDDAMRTRVLNALTS
ncbi:hypothetical protein MVES1_000294 [Malassezia vespertilionis]|uniref:uncharacterized protein n=1 Tax=Malassezia vespertilionis TaxID=2020962 RepID=UPI0024B05DA9|nr:uncharacterized protein MVES1_000294 [Malassezia vespertilionis]WFD04969.1 hypothetical protein MVES1_000294 [Malassezia vespertilionis]